MRGNRHRDHQYSTSDGAGLFFSSPSDLSPGPQWTPPAIQAINIDDYGPVARRDSANDPFFRRASFTPAVEGTSANPYGGGSASSCSDSSESDIPGKPCLSSHHNSSSRHFFMSKPIHPLALPTQNPREASCSTAAGSSESCGMTPQREPHRWSSASSGVDITEVSEPFEHESFSQSRNSSVGFRCGLCERFLSQKSPWSSRRIVRSGDLPVASVLPCRHVFHAECLDQTTPKNRKNDPPCPLCHILEEEDCPDRRNFPRLRSGFPRLKPLGEDGQSRPWGCVQVGDCVEGALHVPPRNKMMLLNRNRMKRNLSLRGNATKEFPGKLRKSDSLHSQRLSGMSSDQGAVGVGSSKTAVPGMKKM